MRNIYYLVKKNLKLLIRSKSSALIIILSPLLFILLIGLSYNTSQTGLNIGVYAPDFNKDVNSFVSSLQEEQYKIIKYDNSLDCIGDIKLGFTHTCVVLPKDFQIKDNKQKEITFHIDQTKINLVYMVTNVLNTKFNLKSEEVSKELISGILNKITTTEGKIKKEVTQIESTKAKNQQAAKESEAIKADLTKLDLKAPAAKTYDTTSLDNFKKAANTKTADVKTKLNSVESAVDSSNLNSSEKSEINDQVSDAKAELTQLVNLLEGTNNTTSSLAEVSTMVSGLQSDMGEIKKKLTTASSKVSASGTKLNSLASSVKASVTSLDAIKKTLDEIQKDLASQKVTSASTITAPIKTNIKKITTEKTYLGYMFPSLIIMVVMFVSILLGTTLVMMEKHSPAYFRNFMMPVRKITFIFSTYLTNVLLILIQVVIILGVSLVFLGDIYDKLPLTTLILFLASSTFTLIGILIGYLFNSEDSGTLASISVGSLLLFVSGVILPLENMTAVVRKVIHYNPFVLAEKLLREVFIFGSSIQVIYQDLLMLAGYGLGLFILILIIDGIIGKHFVTKLSYKHHKHIREKKKKLMKKLKKK